MSNIAVMGDKMSIFGFGALGVITAVCEEKEDAVLKFDELVKSDCKIIYITENVAELIADKIEKYRFSPYPAIILIPSVSHRTGKGMKDLEISVEKAIGSKLI